MYIRVLDIPSPISLGHVVLSQKLTKALSKASCMRAGPVLDFRTARVSRGPFPDVGSHTGRSACAPSGRRAVVAAVAAKCTARARPAQRRQGARGRAADGTLGSRLTHALDRADKPRRVLHVETERAPHAALSIWRQRLHIWLRSVASKLVPVGRVQGAIDAVRALNSSLIILHDPDSPGYHPKPFWLSHFTLQRATLTGVLLSSILSSVVTASTRSSHACCTRATWMPLGPNTVWDRVSEAHVHWVPSKAVVAVAFHSAASYPHERAAKLNAVKCRDCVDKKLSRVLH